MPKNLTDVNAFTSPVVVPVDADARNALSAEVGFQPLADRTHYLHKILTDNPGQVTVAAFQQIRYIGGIGVSTHVGAFADWTEVSAGYKSQVNSARLLYDLTKSLGRSETLQRVRALVNPGVARAGANRMLMTLFGHSYGASFAAPTGPTFTSHATQYDDATTNLQWLTMDLTGAPIAVASDVTWGLEIIAGNDAGTNKDDVYAVALEVSTDRIANF